MYFYFGMAVGAVSMAILMLILMGFVLRGAEPSKYRKSVDDEILRHHRHASEQLERRNDIGEEMVQALKDQNVLMGGTTQ